MSLLKALIVFLMTVGFSLQLKAMDFQSESTSNDNSLSVLAEGSQFTLEKGSLMGTGIRVDLAHAISRRISIEVFLTSALASDKTISSSFTGYGGSLYFTVWGECCQKSKSLSVDGSPLLYDNEPRFQQVQIGLGLNQYLLNGSEGVYSASGLGVGLNYLFSIWSWNFKVSGRFSEMTSGSQKVQGQFIGAGILFQL